VEYIDGDTCIFRIGVQAVDAGEIDQDQIAAADTAELAEMLFDGDSGVVGDLLTKAREPIEECRLARVRRPDQRDSADLASNRSSEVFLNCTNADRTGRFASQSDFKTIDVVDGWIACRCPTYDDDSRFGNYAHVHEVMSYLVRKVQGLDDRHFPDA
jgi:hypothetical protein